MIDNKLTWRPHIDYVYFKLLKFIGIFYKLRWHVSNTVLTENAVLCICSLALVIWYRSVWYNTSKNNINKLLVLNNKILRIVQNKLLQHRVLNLYKNYNTLPLPELLYQLLCLVHKYHYRNDKMPVIFSDYFSCNKDIHHHTRSSSLLHLSSVSTSVGTKSTKFKASQLWNTLPERLRKIKNFNSFKTELSNYLIDNIMR